MPVVDVSFNIIGKNIPADHGYHLYSAISKSVPELHENSNIGIHPISGTLMGNRLLGLNKQSQLIIRTPVEDIPKVIELAGKSLSVDSHSVNIGVLTTKALIPTVNLFSRLVIIKGFMDPEPFLEAVSRQLNNLSIQGNPSLIKIDLSGNKSLEQLEGTKSPYIRRTICIHDKEVVGFALRVGELNAKESMLLQEKGIGGRRRFGCGLFIPDRR